MVDRKLAGIMAIALILSSGGFSFFVGEKAEEPVEILNEGWNIPLNVQGNFELPITEGRYVYSLGFVVREPLRRLELYFATLENSSFETDPDSSPVAGLAGVHGLGDLIATVQKYSTSSLARLGKPEFNLSTPGAEYTGLAIDLSDHVGPVAPDEIRYRLPTFHAVLLNSSGRVNQYYRGFPDFYLNREQAILDITIQKNQNVTRFSKRVTQQGNSLPMEDLPPTAHLVFDELEKEDQIFLTIAIDSSRPELSSVINPPKEAVIHLVLMYINEEHQSTMASLIYR